MRWSQKLTFTTDFHLWNMLFVEADLRNQTCYYERKQGPSVVSRSSDFKAILGFISGSQLIAVRENHHRLYAVCTYSVNIVSSLKILNLKKDKQNALLVCFVFFFFFLMTEGKTASKRSKPLQHLRQQTRHTDSILYMIYQFNPVFVFFVVFFYFIFISYLRATLARSCIRIRSRRDAATHLVECDDLTSDLNQSDSILFS